MKETFRKIWKDPVLGSIIGTAIVAAGTGLYNAISNKSNFSAEFVRFWGIKVEIWVVASALIIAFILAKIYKFVRGGRWFNYDSQTLKLDQQLFIRIYTKILTQEDVLPLRHNGFSGRPFQGEELTSVLKILEEAPRSDFKFLNPYLERLKLKLVKEIDIFEEYVTSYIYGTNNSGWLAIPSEWEFQQPERMEEAIKNLSKQEITISNKYDEFFKSCRKILKV